MAPRHDHRTLLGIALIALVGVRDAILLGLLAIRLRARRHGDRLRRDGRARDRRVACAGGIRGSAFGLLATVRSLANVAASAVAGLLWTLVSPFAAFAYASAWMVLAVLAFAALRGD